MAIFRILYHDDTIVVEEHFSAAKVKVVPSSYSGDVFTNLLKLLKKNKSLFKVYQESTILHRVKRKKEREDKLESTTVVQLKEHDIHTHVSNGKYIVFLPIRKGKSTRLQYLKESIKSLMVKAREFNSVLLAFPIYKDSFDSLKVKDIIDVIIENKDSYPAYVYLYTEKKYIKVIEKALKKNDIIYDLKEIKS